MILAIPIFLLLFTSGLILGIRLTRPTFPALWLIAVAGSLVSWISMLALRLQLPSTLTLLKWSDSAIFNSSPALVLDYSSWGFSFAIVTLDLLIVLISPGQMRTRGEVINLSGSLALGGLALVAVLSANPITLLLGWASMDIVELLIFTRGSEKIDQLRRTIRVYSSRVMGLILAFWAFVLGSRAIGYNTSFDTISPQVGVFLLISIGLRLGVFPLHMPFTVDTNVRRGQGTLLRMAPAASALVVLSRLPSTTVAPGFEIWLSIFAALALMYSSIRWLIEKDELLARPYWIISLSASAIICVLTGSPFLSLSWGISLIFLSSALFLFDSYNRFMRILAWIGLINLAGLPFTANSSGIQALAAEGHIYWIIPAFIALFFLIYGMADKIKSKPVMPTNQEKIIYLTYPLSMLLLTASYIITGLFGWRGSRVEGLWWFTIPLGLICISLIVWNIKTGTFETLINRMRAIIDISPESPGAISVLQRVINLDWMYGLVQVMIRGVNAVVIRVESVLEGQGGFLWAALIFVLFLALIQIGGG